MLKGHIVAEGMVLVDGTGLPVVETDPPAVPGGYVARYSWKEAYGAITQVWEVVPEAGTVADAVERLAVMQARSLPDEEAVEVSQLYPAWDGGHTLYAEGERVRFDGRLYRVLETHTSQEDWDPSKAPSLFAPILPGQSGEVGEWVRPDSTNAYSKGDRVTHGGKLWESTADNNVWEPGTTGAPWREVG